MERPHFLTDFSYFYFEKPHDIIGLSMLCHELKHLEQQRKIGIFRFLLSYIMEEIKFLVRFLLSKKKFSLAEYFQEEYWKISFEKEAYLCQKEFLESFGIDIKTIYPYLEF